MGTRDAGGSTIGAWQLLDESALAAAIEAGGYDPAEAPLFAAQVVAANDRNDDGLVCVMTQVLPNDASGANTFFVAHDNNAREK